MNDKGRHSDKPYIYAFSSGRLVALACIVLVLVALSLMLGIRIEKYQASREIAAFEPPPPAPPQTPPPTIKPPLEKPPPEPVDQPSAKETVAETSVSPSPETPLTRKEESAPAPVSKTTKKAEAPAPAAKKEQTAPQPPATTAKPVKGHFAVQVSSSQDKALADSLVGILRKQEFKSYLEETTLESGGGTWFRVLVGPYATRDEAEKAQKEIAKDSRFADSYVRYLP